VTQSAESSSPTRERRRPRDLDELLDREEIRNLVDHYMYAVDAKDWAAWADLLTDDVRIILPHGSHEGKEGAIDFDKESRPGRRMHHLNSGTVVSVDGDVAAARSYMRYVTHDAATPGEDAVDIAGVFSWSFRRENGEWRIAVMEWQPTWQSDVVGLGEPLSRVVAEREIRTALDHYRAGMDGDPDRVLDAFHPDGALAMGELEVVGSGQIRDAVAAVSAAWVDINHFATSLEGAFQDEQTASGTSYGLGVFVAEDGVTMSAAGRYRDLYERREGVWRLSRRENELRPCAVSAAADVYVAPAGIDPAWFERVREASAAG
jgi:ketosteroid isomerase-like protein